MIRTIMRKIFVFIKQKCFFVGDKMIYRMKFFIENKSCINFKNPTTFNEKLYSLQLKYNLKIYCDLSDKIVVRNYVEEMIGREFLPKIFGEFEKFDLIDFDLLPNSFVVKTNHDSGGVYIVNDKNNFNYEDCKKKINKHLKRNYYYEHREKQYKNIKRKIFIEELLIQDDEIDLIDYKVFCFNGVPKFTQVHYDRGTNHSINCYDNNWCFIPGEISKPNKLDAIDNDNYKPECLEKMLSNASVLSKGFEFVRVDFYIISNKLYFGEMTFSPGAGNPTLPEKLKQECSKYL